MISKEARTTFATRKQGTAIVTITSKVIFAMNVQIIIMISHLVNPADAMTKEAKTTIVTLKVEIVIVRKTYVGKSVTNVVNTILDFQTAKVLFQIMLSSLFSNPYICICTSECKCFSLGTRDNTTCSSSGKCNCKPGYVGDNCESCASGYYKLKNGLCQGTINSRQALINRS